MKKNTYLGIISGITVICIAIGLMVHVFFWQTGERYIEKNETLKEFDRVEAEMEIVNFHIKAGTAYELYYHGNENYEPHYEVKNGTLVIEQKRKEWKILNFSGAEDMELILVVPADALKELKVQADVGCVIAEGICCERGDIESDIGEVCLENSEFQYLTVESDIGAVEARLLGKETDYTLNLLTDLGDVEINDKTAGKQYHSQGEGGKEISITIDIGAIELRFE